MDLLRFIGSELNDLFYREYRLRRKIKRHIAPYYDNQQPFALNTNKMIIFMADGRKRHGGLADRLRGIISTYKYCLEHHIDFRIYFVSPFRLDQLLIPNEYNWIVSEKEISYNSLSSLPVYIDSNVRSNNDIAFQRKMTEKYFAKDYRQIHVYTNMYYADSEFGPLFCQLFKPAPALQAWINENLISLGNRYISFAFRFQNLFGDFNDGRNILQREEKEELCSHCIAKLRELRNRHLDIERFLVTADSEWFLKEVAKLDFVYVLPGKVGHMDDASENNLKTHMKTLLDFFMLSKSEKIYLLVTGKMYKSGFSKRAAKLNNIPFEEIIF